MAHYLSNDKKDQLQVEIIDVIQNNSEIYENMNLSDTKRIDHAIDLIEIVVAQEFNKFQLTTFNGYNTKLANLINDY